MGVYTTAMGLYCAFFASIPPLFDVIFDVNGYFRNANVWLQHFDDTLRQELSPSPSVDVSPPPQCLFIRHTPQ